MKNTKMLAIFVLAMGPVVWSGQATSPGSIVGWGQNSDGQATPPDGSDFVAIAAGDRHSLALKSDGWVVGWGNNDFGQADTPPAGNDFIAIAAGGAHSLALKSDGQIVGWGANSWGQANPPADTDFVAIAAGLSHSLALKTDGSIVGWGLNHLGQANPPTGNDFVAIAAGMYHHSLALKSDGSIVGWGANFASQATPPAGDDFVAIAAGTYHSLALKSDGSVVGWGSNAETSPPAGNDFVAIASGGDHSLALKSDGSIVGWGYNSEGQATSPEGDDFIAIAAGGYHSLAIKATPSGEPDNDWIVSGENMYAVPTGNVGIGTTSPVAKLDVVGDIAVNSTLVINSLGQWVGDPTGLQGPPGPQGPKGDNGDPGPEGPTLGIYDSLGLNSSGGHAAGDAGGRTLYNLGNVGIGTTSPEGKLHVSGGNIRVDYTSGIDIIQQNGYVSGINPYRNDLNILNSATGDIKFLTGTLPNNTHPRLLIANDGNVGIGTTSPSEKLDVAGAANLNKGISTGIALQVNGAEALWYNGTYFSWGFGGTANFFADSVGIGQVDPGPHKLYVNGTGYATGGFWASDLRFKKNIKTIVSPMDKISKIRGVSFEWKRSEYQDKGLPEGEHYGVIAQEIEQVLPEIVKEGPNGDKAVSYTELVPILTEAIKEQQEQLEEQQMQVEYLLQKVEWLERIVQQQFAAAR